jgi:O-antigen/teichoic acid export membrane protein
LNILQRTLKGIFWVYASFFGGRLLTLLSTAILARILVPEDFGVIGFALIFLTFIEAARSFGVNEALIYTSEKVEEAADTVFIINVGLSIVQFVVAVLLAPLLVNFFDDPRIVSVVQVISLTFILDGLGQTHDALLQKELEFRRRFLPELLASIVKGVVSVVLALMGFGIWSLVYGNLVGSAMRTIAKWWVMRWRPRLRFYMDRARALWNYGMHILMFQMLGIAIDQADQLLIGVLLGQLQLGYYAIAMRVPELVIANFSMVLTRVLFPTFAKLKSDMGQLTRGFLETTRFTALITVPLGLGMAAVAPELVLVLFGDQWEAAIILMQVLALLGTMNTLPWCAGDVLKAIGRPDVSTKLLVIESLFTFPLIYVLVSQTHLAVMAAVANLIASTITVVLRLAVISRFLDVTRSDFFHIFKSPFLAGALMFAAVTVWRVLVGGWPLAITLISSIIVGAIAYSALIWLLERDTIRQAASVLMDVVRKRGEDYTPAPAGPLDGSES